MTLGKMMSAPVKGIIRFIDFAASAGKNGSDRPPAEQLLKTIDSLGLK